ncbi:MAG TPA: hypothetical protein VFB49_02365 [Patescibacteria group bacterium]|nr:hypothetical protein [Patescibacteria group bacterium]
MNTVRMPPPRTHSGAILAVCLVGASACGPVGGAARFWNGYRSEFIVAQQSDQGPWGGWRWIQWRADSPGTFQESAVRAFAESKGWKCVQRDEYSAKEVGTWVTWKGQPIFPLLEPMDRGPDYYQQPERAPRHISSDSVVLKCDSGWMRSDPVGHDPDLVTAYGFIHLGQDGREMAVYHLWGE